MHGLLGAVMLRVGLTGGIGSGKSTVAAMLVEAGAVLVDADAISRQVTAKDGVALPAIAAALGADLVVDGVLDRVRLRQLVFSNPEAKRQIEAIIHPLVAEQMQTALAQASAAGAKWVVLDIPLLVESGRWRAEVDQVWVVDCEVETQIRRVMARSRTSREEVQAVIAQQATRSQRLAAADVVIFNETLGLEALRTLVFGLLPRLALSLP